MTVRATHIHPNNDKLILGHDIYDYNCTHPRVSQFTQWLLGGFRGPIFSRGMPWSEGYRSVEIWMFAGLTGFIGPSEVLLWPVSSTACDRECPVFLSCILLYLMLIDVDWWSLIRLLCRMPHILYLKRMCKQLLALYLCSLVLKLYAGRKLSEEPVCKAWGHVHMRLPGNCHTIFGRRELWGLWHLVSMASCYIVYDVFTRNGNRKVWSCWRLDLQLEVIFSHGPFVEVSWTVHWGLWVSQQHLVTNCSPSSTRKEVLLAQWPWQVSLLRRIGTQRTLSSEWFLSLAWEPSSADKNWMGCTKNLWRPGIKIQRGWNSEVQWSISTNLRWFPRMKKLCAGHLNHFLRGPSNVREGEGNFYVSYSDYSIFWGCLG